MHALLDRLFGRAEEINGAFRCPTYLYRWTLAHFKWGKVYLHKFVGDDWSLDLHDHPKRFVSIGLWGSYLETVPYKFGLHCDTDDTSVSRRWRAPWFRTFPATHRHRITTPFGHCWTLVIVFKTVRDWGFWHDGEFYSWDEYVRGKDGIADKMTSCN